MRLVYYKKKSGGLLKLSNLIRRTCVCFGKDFLHSPFEFDFSIVRTFSPHWFLSPPNHFLSSLHFLKKVTLHTYPIPVLHVPTDYLAVTFNPSVGTLSWIMLSPIPSLHDRIYSCTSQHTPFSTRTVTSTVTRLCSLCIEHKTQQYCWKKIPLNCIYNCKNLHSPLLVMN